MFPGVNLLAELASRKRRREPEAESGLGSANVSGPEFADVTLTHTGKRARRASKPTLEQTPPGKKKERLEQREADSDQENFEDILKSDPPGGAPSSSRTLLTGPKPADPLPLYAQRGPRSSNADLLASISRVSRSKANRPSEVFVPATPSPSPPQDPPPCSRSPVQNPTPLCEVPSPTLPLQTPGRDRMETGQPCSSVSLLRKSTLLADFCDEVVPTSQPSQDLRPYIMSPPRPGGTVLKDSTPKALRRSQGYIDQPTPPLPSLLAVIQARGHTRTQEANSASTSQMEEAELWSPRSVQAGLSFCSPPPKCDKAILGHNKLPSSDQTGVFKTPTKLAGVPLGEIVNVVSPIAPQLDSPESTPSDNSTSTSALLRYVLSSSPSPHSPSRDHSDFDFVSYKPTPTKRTLPADSPKDDLELFESQTLFSPPWTQPRSFEMQSHRYFRDGKAGLEAEAEGREPGEELRASDGEESEKGARMASSVTEEDSQDMVNYLLRANPGLKYAGKAPPCRSGPSSGESRSDFNSGKSGRPDPAGLEAEAEEHEPGEELRASDGEESEKGVRMASSVTEEGSQDMVDYLLRANPGLKYAGKAPPCRSSPSSGESRSDFDSKKSGRPDPIKNNIKKGKASPVKTPRSLTESEPQSGGSGGTRDHGGSQGGSLSDSTLTFTQPTLGPLTAVLDMFEEGSSVPYGSY